MVWRQPGSCSPGTGEDLLVKPTALMVVSGAIKVLAFCSDVFVGPTKCYQQTVMADALS
jgi:hypothetical protein